VSLLVLILSVDLALSKAESRPKRQGFWNQGGGAFGFQQSQPQNPGRSSFYDNKLVSNSTDQGVRIRGWNFYNCSKFIPQLFNSFVLYADGEYPHLIRFIPMGRTQFVGGIFLHSASHSPIPWESFYQHEHMGE